ncbi:MAG: NAD(+) synthase [Reichenbachiella sp.]
MVKIGGACLNQTPIDWEGNFNNIKASIETAISQQVNILCLPELCITSYGCQDLFLHNWVSEQALEVLSKVVPLCKHIAVSVGLPMIVDNQTYNVVCIIADAKIQGFYAKQFLANDGIHYEKRWFNPWPKNTMSKIVLDGHSYPIGDQTFILSGVRVGFEICEDAWNQDRPACRLYDKGVQLILNPSASHFSFNKVKTREDLVIDSSQQFDCYYLYANQLGNESGRVIYDGDVLLAHKGELLRRNKRFSFKPFNLVTYKIGVIDKESIQEQHFSNSLEEFSPAVSLALYDYLRKSRAKGYTLSLSGGADSSSIAVLVTEMVKNATREIGIEAFIASINCNASESATVNSLVKQLLFVAYQGTQNSGQETLESAEKLAESLGATFKSWNIDPLLQSSHHIVENAIDRKLSWETDDIALQNIQARSRSPLIWMIANINQQILLTTSNRSEGDVGYTTMDGDTSGSLAPIAGVDKPFILQWLKYAEEKLGYEGLKFVNALTPTAELRPKEYTQTDEDDLMPYSVLRDIERLGIFERKSPITVFSELKNSLKIDHDQLKGYVKKFYRLWSINQWKRERLAPSFHIDDFNVDPKTWCRFPILSGGFEKELKEIESI